MVFSELEKKERHKEACKKYRKNNKKKAEESNRKYRKNNKEKIVEINKEYRQTPIGKKSNTLSNWKTYGLNETNEFLEEIYELYLNQEECNACGILLTRTGGNCSTDVCMDHCHTTGKFRHIICGFCNRKDNWKKYFIM